MIDESNLGLFGFLTWVNHEGGLGFAVLLMLAAAVIAYFLGCFNGAVIVSKYILRNDIRNHGSGNAGLTNFYRVFGGGLTFVVILCDVLKAVLAILIGTALFHVLGGVGLEVTGKYWAGLFCLLGHMFPCMFHFKGGKGLLRGGKSVVLVLVLSIIIGGLIVWKHRGNLKRILSGTESKFSLHKKKEGTQ